MVFVFFSVAYMKQEREVSHLSMDVIFNVQGGHLYIGVTGSLRLSYIVFRCSNILHVYTVLLAYVYRAIL